MTPAERRRREKAAVAALQTPQQLKTFQSAQRSWRRAEFSKMKADAALGRFHDASAIFYAHRKLALVERAQSELVRGHMRGLRAR